MSIELRSDTFTLPTEGMLEAMRMAPLGDDVFGEDPTVNELEAYVAGLFGMEAALFCPSGTMTNQIAIKVHTQPGDEVICDELSHVYQYEGGGIAFNSGCSTRCLVGDRGRITAAQVRAAINPDDVHKARTSLVVLENTSNRGGGACYKKEAIEEIAEVCREDKLTLHLDGARVWNAMVANNEDPLWYGRQFATISVCLSKGLGAPVGSVLAGNKEHIKKARRIRKVLGGGMRQAGVIAAAGLYAIRNHLEGLKADHTNAKLVAEALKGVSWCRAMKPVETNILIFDTEQPAKDVVQKLHDKHAIRCLPIAQHSVRMVFHLGVTSQQAATTAEAISTLY